MRCPQCDNELEVYNGRVLKSGKPEKLFYCPTHGTFCDWSLKKKNQINKTVTCYWCGNNHGYLFLYDPTIPDFTCLKCGNRFPVPNGVSIRGFKVKEFEQQ